MKIAIDPGHNCRPDIGAVGLGRKEDVLVKSLAFAIEKLLVEQGHEVEICLPKSASSVISSLMARTRIANRFNADLYVSLHFNAFYKASANGAEVWIFASNSLAKDRANAVLENICDMGLRRRGVKIGNFAVLKHTNMPAMLVECAFITNASDMEKYDESKYALAITKGILGASYIDMSQEKIESEKIKLIVEIGTYLKPSTEQSSSLNFLELIKIKAGEYNAELIGEEEGHYLVKFKDEFDIQKEYFIFSGHCKLEFRI